MDLPVEQGVMDMAEDYDSMTVAQLKSCSRNKACPSQEEVRLIDRLQEAAGVADEAVVEDDAPVEEDSEDDAWDDGDWEDEEDDVYMAKQKPVLSEDMKAALALRSAQKKKTLPSDEPNGSDKRLSRSDGAHPTGWTANNDGTTSTAVRSFASVTEKWQPPASSTHQGSAK